MTRVGFKQIQITFLATGTFPEWEPGIDWGSNYHNCTEAWFGSAKQGYSYDN